MHMIKMITCLNYMRLFTKKPFVFDVDKIAGTVGNTFTKTCD